MWDSNHLPFAVQPSPLALLANSNAILSQLNPPLRHPIHLLGRFVKSYITTVQGLSTFQIGGELVNAGFGENVAATMIQASPLVVRVLIYDAIRRR